MTATVCLDIDQLLAPIPGEFPAGDARAYAHRLHEQLNEQRREDDPDDYDEATRPAEFKKADWDGVVELASVALQAESKDLRVACHLVEALTQLDNFDGLQRGITLLRRLVEECWDWLIPELDDDDPDARSAPLANMLDDAVRGLCFPNLVRSLPILGQGETATSVVDWHRLPAGTETSQRDAVIAATDPDRLIAQANVMDACLEELTALRAALEEKLGDHAPGFLHLGEAINDCRNLARNALRELRPEIANADSDADDQADASDAAVAGQTLATTNRPSGVDPEADRQTVYRQIEDAANLLGRLEPHSPVPYLVQRAVELGRLPFPQMIKQFVREENALSELYRELGINAAAGEESPVGAS